MGFRVLNPKPMIQITTWENVLFLKINRGAQVNIFWIAPNLMTNLTSLCHENTIFVLWNNSQELRNLHTQLRKAMTFLITFTTSSMISFEALRPLKHYVNKNYEQRGRRRLQQTRRRSFSSKVNQSLIIMVSVPCTFLIHVPNSTCSSSFVVHSLAS
jgi:hypothetical protein